MYKIQIDGAQDYIAGVTSCFDLIESVAEGKKLLQAITTLSHQVFIQDTTGMPPYNFEELSDNKMRSQWPQHLNLRMNY